MAMAAKPSSYFKIAIDRHPSVSGGLPHAWASQTRERENERAEFMVETAACRPHTRHIPHYIYEDLQLVSFSKVENIR